MTLLHICECCCTMQIMYVCQTNGLFYNIDPVDLFDFVIHVDQAAHMIIEFQQFEPPNYCKLKQTASVGVAFSRTNSLSTFNNDIIIAHV